MEIILFCFATGIWTLSFPLKIISKNIFIFQKLKLLRFWLFQKNKTFGNFFKNGSATFPQIQQSGELFPKRFTTGICDLGGHPAFSPWHPIYVFFVFFLNAFTDTTKPSLLVGGLSVTVIPLKSICDLSGHQEQVGIVIYY